VCVEAKPESNPERENEKIQGVLQGRRKCNLTKVTSGMSGNVVE